MTLSALTQEQWFKVAKALVYSFVSGFIGGITLTLSNYLQNGQDVDAKFVHSLVIASVVGGINTVIVFIKQAFTPAQ